MEKVPFVGYKLQYQNLKSEIDPVMQDVLARGDLIMRKDNDEFERKFSEFVGTKYAIGLNSGTDALLFSLLALGYDSTIQTELTGADVRAERARYGVTQVALAKVMNWHLATLVNVENGSPELNQASYEELLARVRSLATKVK